MSLDLHRVITSARWFGGTGRELEITGVRPIPLGEQAQILLVDCLLDDEPVTFQVLDGGGNEDAADDPAAVLALSEAITGQELSPATPVTLLTGEQSNTSIRIGDAGEIGLLKVFRRVRPGINPDVELHQALTEAGSPYVAKLLGVLERDGTQLAMLQELLAGARDGWELALDAARSPDSFARSFSAEARALGTVVAHLHQTLAAALPTDTVPGAQIAVRLQRRLDEAVAATPVLAPFADAIRQAYQGLSDIAQVPVQRVHGDLHLGQCLLVADGWRIVDFEGEPAQSLDERRSPDSLWRDVAGMLRSFDYAGTSVDADPRWISAATDAFLAGYAAVAGNPDDIDRQLLRAFELDKAIYEVVYETRNRPDWLHIPLDALGRLV